MGSIKVSRNIDAPVAKVWEALDDFGGVHRFSASVESSPITEGTPERGVGSVRVCNLYDGNHIEERVANVVENKSIEIDIVSTSMPIKDASGRFDLVPVTGGGTQVSMEMNYTVKMGPIGWLMDKLMMTRMMNKSLGNLLASLDHYVTTGEEISSGWKPERKAA